MCGIVAYVGSQSAPPLLLEGLKKLEYRGYDSAGIAILNNSTELINNRKKGKVKELESLLVQANPQGNIGIGHTRWATHGEPSDHNSHPHLSQDGSIALVHNGIIENHQELKQVLIDLGYQFHSDTDTEVVVHLIQEIRDSMNINIYDAVQEATKKLVGAYAIAVLDKKEPSVLVGARKSSPLVIGLGKEEYFLASDPLPFAQYTNKYIFLEDNEVVKIDRYHGYHITNTSNDQSVHPTIQHIDIKVEELEKNGYPHFMLKEIFQQPHTVEDTMRGRLNTAEKWVSVGGLTSEIDRFAKARKITLVACGTSWHTALIGEYLLEEIAKVPCEVEYASEFRYRNPLINDEDILLFISQSGETADTLAAMELAKQKGALTYGIVNVVGSSIARLSDTGSYTHAGPEIGVASTKAFTSQVTLICMMALQIGYKKGTISTERYNQLIAELANIPTKISSILDTSDKIKYISSEIKSASNALYLGRGINFPVALEGALKLKEISYIHAEGYPAAEMKHGPIALIDMYMPVVVIATKGGSYDKIVSNIEEVKARKGIIIAVVNEGDTKIKSLADFYIEIPETEEVFSPLLTVIPLQILSYHIAVMRGCDVDQPRNLAKSVTVE